MTSSQDGEPVPPDDTQEDMTSTMHIDISPEELDGIKTKSTRPRPTTRIHRRPKTTLMRKPATQSVLGGSNFRELLQNIYDAVLITQFDGTIMNANARAAQFFGSTQEELPSQSISSLVSGSEGVLLPTILKNLEKGRYTLVQAYCLRTDGSSFPAEISANRIRVSEEDYLSFFIRDTTLRRETEERLLTGYTALHNAGSGVAITDLEGSISYCNPTLLRVWGVADMEQATNVNVSSFLADPQLAGTVKDAVRRGESRQGEVEMRRQDGSPFYAYLSVVPNYNTDKEISGMVFSLVDVTREKEVQQQLEIFANELSEKNKDLENDLAMARELQQAFIPDEYPVIPPGASPEESALRFSHIYIPCGAVGGDYFDVWPISDTQVGVFFADVSGHGLRAALVVSTLRGLVEELSDLAHDPGAFITRMNSTFANIFHGLDEFMYVTAVYCVVDTETRSVRYTNAGHPPPIRIHDQRKTVEMMELEHDLQGPGIGLQEEYEFVSVEVPLEPHDVLVLYTDGLYEVFDADRESYELERLEASVRRHRALPADQIGEALLKDVKDFGGAQEFDDDVCLLSIEMVDR